MSEASRQPSAAAETVPIGEPFLIARQVTKQFGGLLAVDSVDLTINRREIVGLIGPNGAGKTTFFNIIAGIYQPTSGEVIFDGSPIFARRSGLLGHTTTRPDQVMERGIARTFQNIRLFANMTALENVLVGMHCRLRGSTLGALLRPPSVKREEREARERAREVLDYVGLAGKGSEFAKNLAYGDQRRLEIGRALASNPKMLLLDEPTAGMNPQETAALTRFIDQIRRELELTVLLIEHDMKVVMGISDRVAVLDHGIKLAEGTPSEIQHDPRVIEAYLGKGAAEVVAREAAPATPPVDNQEPAMNRGERD